MAKVSELAKLKAEMERMREERSRAQGALDQIMARLKNEYGCATLKEAEDKLAKLERRASRAEAEFDLELEAFKNRHREALNGTDTPESAEIT